MQIKLFGAAKTVPGSCYSLKTKKDRILIDCGMFQGSKKLVKLNYKNFLFAPKTYKTLLLTHAHLDHCGRIPFLVKNGFKRWKTVWRVKAIEDFEKRQNSKHKARMRHTQSR